MWTLNDGDSSSASRPSPAAVVAFCVCAVVLGALGMAGCPRERGRSAQAPSPSPQASPAKAAERELSGTIAFVRVLAEEPARTALWAIDLGGEGQAREVVVSPPGQWLDNPWPGPEPGTVFLDIWRGGAEPEEAEFDIVLCDLTTGKLSSITTDGQSALPVWCAEKQRLFFVRRAGWQSQAIVSMTPEGEDRLVVWEPSNGELWLPSALACSPDGSWLAVADDAGDCVTVAMFVDTARQEAHWAWEGGVPEPLAGLTLPEDLVISAARWSHDGTRIALITQRAEVAESTASLAGPAFVFEPASGKLTKILDDALALSWAPDDSALVVSQSVEYEQGRGSRLMIVAPGGEEPTLLVDYAWRPAWCRQKEK